MENSISAQSLLDSITSQIMRSNRAEKEVYRIGDLASEFDVTLRTLRFYEDRGLITPKRSGSTRLYSPGDRNRLKVIILAKKAGFSLIDIQNLLKIYDDGGSGSEIQTVRVKFLSQLETLKEQKSQLEQSIVDLQRAIATIDGASK